MHRKPNNAQNTQHKLGVVFSYLKRNNHLKTSTQIKSNYANSTNPYIPLPWISDAYFESFFTPSVTYETSKSTIQWRHYSFVLIHAKSKTQFSAGKQRQIVWKGLHDIELVYSFCRHSCLTFKLSTAWSTLNQSNSIAIAQWNKYIHTEHFKKTTICFGWKEAICSLTKKKENNADNLLIWVRLRNVSAWILKIIGLIFRSIPKNGLLFQMWVVNDTLWRGLFLRAATPKLSLLVKFINEYKIKISAHKMNTVRQIYD